MGKPSVYTVTVQREPHVCGLCGPSTMIITTASDGLRTRVFRQSTCDNSDYITPGAALDWLIYDENERDEAG